MNGFLGGVAGSSGALTVSGAGSTLNVSGDLYPGGTTTASLIERRGNRERDGGRDNQRGGDAADL